MTNIEKFLCSFHLAFIFLFIIFVFTFCYIKINILHKNIEYDKSLKLIY